MFLQPKWFARTGKFRSVKCKMAAECKLQSIALLWGGVVNSLLCAKYTIDMMKFVNFAHCIFL